LMLTDDLDHFKVPSTQSSYKDVVKGNATAAKSLIDSTRDFRKMDWDKVGGLKSAKERLLNAANSLNSDFRVSGVLLYGPPGTGKTLLARALATKLNWPLLARSIGDLLHSYIGESEKAIEKMFDDAAKLQPCIIFLDELDALFNGGVGMGRRMSAHLCHQFDEIIRKRDKVLVIGATNHVERIDKSLQRIGRFESSIMVGLPDCEERKSILIALGVPSGVADIVSQKTNDMTGAEIAQLVQMARQHMLTSGAIELTADMFDKV
jgi:SpoVK/Ycf46/Vps4 family AAA+-type ATPase